MYCVKNFKTKKAFKTAYTNWIAGAGPAIEVIQPGPFGPHVPDGRGAVEGPHYSEPHRWYASVIVKDGRIVKVTG